MKLIAMNIAIVREIMLSGRTEGKHVVKKDAVHGLSCILVTNKGPMQGGHPKHQLQAFYSHHCTHAHNHTTPSPSPRVAI